MDNMLKEYIEKLKLVDTVEEYEEFMFNGCCESLDFIGFFGN